MIEDLPFRLVLPLIQKREVSEEQFREFLNEYCEPSDYFEAVRLILPGIDRERCCFGDRLAIVDSCLRALGLPVQDTVSAGFETLLEDELVAKGNVSKGLTVKEVNQFLDDLALNRNRDDQIATFTSLISKTDAQEMNSILYITSRDSNRLPSWFYSDIFAGFDFTTNPLIFSKDAATLMALLRRREMRLALGARYSVEQKHHATSTSARASLHLQTLNNIPEEVSRVYTIYDNSTAALDVWFIPSDTVNSSPRWISLNTTRMSPVGSRSFVDDEQFSLFSAFLGKGVELFFPSLAPPTINLYGIFSLHHQEIEDDFPHCFSLSVSSSETRAKALPFNCSDKIAKSCLFTFSGITLTNPVDRTLLPYKKLELPKFVVDAIEEYKIPEDLGSSTEFFMGVVNTIVHSPAESLETAKHDLAQSILGLQFEASQILHIIRLCVCCLEELDIFDFVEEICMILADRIRGARFIGDPAEYVFTLLRLS